MDALIALFLALLIGGSAQAQTLPSLTAATLPLTGKELTYITQNGLPRQTPVGTFGVGQYCPLTGCTFSGPVNGLTGTLTGHATLDLPLTGGTVSGDTTFSGAGAGLAVTNNATIGGTLGVTGTATLNGQLYTGGRTQIGLIGNTLGIGPNSSPTGDLNISSGAGRLVFYPGAGGIVFAPTYTLGAAPGTATNYTWNSNTTVSGVVASGSGGLFNKIGCNDNADMVTEGGAGSSANCLYVIDNIGSGAKGQRIALLAQFNMLATPADTTANNFYYGAQFSANSAFNDGGTNVQSAGSLGSFSFQTNLNSGATYYTIAEGFEGGVQVASGASAAYVLGGKINVDGCGSISCNGLEITSNTSSIKMGIVFGGAEVPTWAIDPVNGTLIGAQAYTGSPEAMVAKYGVDFSNVTFTTGAFKSTGFLVGPTGVVTGASYVAGSTAGVASKTCTLSTADVGTGVTITITGGIVTATSGC